MSRGIRKIKRRCKGERTPTPKAIIWLRVYVRDEEPRYALELVVQFMDARFLMGAKSTGESVFMADNSFQVLSASTPQLGSNFVYLWGTLVAQNTKVHRKWFEKVWQGFAYEKEMIFALRQWAKTSAYWKKPRSQEHNLFEKKVGQSFSPICIRNEEGQSAWRRFVLE